MARSPFEKAHTEKIKLTKKTKKEIRKIYTDSAKEIGKKLSNLRMVNSSDYLKKIYFENLLKDINITLDRLDKVVESTIISSGEAAGKLAVDAGNEVMKKVGLEIKGAYSYIPKQEVQRIISGKLYGNNWSLSKSIWGNHAKMRSDLEQIISKGLTENKPIKDIADSLTKYVDPSARKPWDWSKVYPGTSAKVDYNAQRLARTMIQHSYQMSLVQSNMYNPFCSGIIWHSEGIHGRTCELCLERDGEIFPLNDLPLDHPNGLCYFEPALESMDVIADRLADWTNGAEDPEIDEYISEGIMS